MKTIEEYAALTYVVKTITKAIADLDVEQQSANEYVIRDGNDAIFLKQETTATGSVITIKDDRKIIFSEDLLEPLQDIAASVKGNDALKASLTETKIIINGLDIETEFVFQAVKDFLDQVSNSYEFVQTVETEVTRIGAGFKFGKHIFRLNIDNGADRVVFEPRFVATFDEGVKKTISADLIKVEAAVNKMFKGA